MGQRRHFSSPSRSSWRRGSRPPSRPPNSARRFAPPGLPPHVAGQRHKDEREKPLNGRRHGPTRSATQRALRTPAAPSTSSATATNRLAGEKPLVRRAGDRRGRFASTGTSTMSKAFLKILRNDIRLLDRLPISPYHAGTGAERPLIPAYFKSGLCCIS